MFSVATVWPRAPLGGSVCSMIDSDFQLWKWPLVVVTWINLSLRDEIKNVNEEKGTRDARQYCKGWLVKSWPP